MQTITINKLFIDRCPVANSDGFGLARCMVPLGVLWNVAQPSNDSASDLI
jgi:hypothetical protein